MRPSWLKVAGCLRSYVIDSKGKEHVVQFAAENWWLADNISLLTRTPSQYFFDAIEDSEVLLIDPPSREAIVEKIRGYAAAFRRGLQRQAAAKDQRIVNSLTTTAEERYLEFLATYPSIQRESRKGCWRHIWVSHPRPSAESARNLLENRRASTPVAL